MPRIGTSPAAARQLGRFVSLPGGPATSPAHCAGDHRVGRIAVWFALHKLTCGIFATIPARRLIRCSIPELRLNGGLAANSPDDTIDDCHRTAPLNAMMGELGSRRISRFSVCPAGEQ